MVQLASDSAHPRGERGWEIKQSDGEPESEREAEKWDRAEMKG